MATEVIVPKLGNSVETCIIVEWKKAEGERVEQGEPLCDVETDKAIMEIESPAGGILLARFFEEGADVAVLATIGAIGEPGESVDHLRPAGAQAAMAVEAAPTEAKAKAPMAPQAAPASTDDRRHKASPRARGLAGRKGIDADALSGTGPDGRVIERDVQAALTSQPKISPVAQAMLDSGGFQAPARGSGPGGRIMAGDLIPAETEAAPVAPALPGQEEAAVIPVKGIRKVIAERMLASLQTTAQLTLNAPADARAILGYRQRLKASDESLGLQKVSINDLILFAVARMLPQFPELNAHFDGEAITRYSNVQLGMAVDTPRGLVVPVIRNANRLALKQLAAEAKRLATASLERRVTPDELTGGTFTVTNLGALGIESFTPVLNPPEVGILGVGSVNLKPVQVGDDVQFIPHIGLSLTINHQVVDGAPAARFLQALASGLADFELLLAV